MTRTERLIVISGAWLIAVIAVVGFFAVYNTRAAGLNTHDRDELNCYRNAVDVHECWTYQGVRGA